ncbi:hypothetical protein B296_00059192 [Ensete ventricosum]|uniref:Uncharacterized protein n=1 Tax=Ensete ventricosum TaxID=4639 RepID=A0A426XIU3_ENSVE|nr:hypothetical protein B296_00059192 [Ensete ventricosum]
MAVASRLVPNGNPIRPTTICAIGGIAGGAHHPWAARIHFHRLIIKHVSIWFSFPFSKILFQIPCLALPPPCPALPFDLFFSELFSFSTCRHVLLR